MAIPAPLVEKFVNPDTAAKYEYTGTWNKGIAWPQVYEGKVCDMPPEVAEKLIEAKHPLFKRKGSASKVNTGETVK